MGNVRPRVTRWLKPLPGMILAALFAVAALDQLTHFGGFVVAVRSYHLLPAGAERFAAIFIIMAELATALGLLLRRWRRPASLAAVLLLAGITAIYMVAIPEGICGSRFTLTLNIGGSLPILQNLAFIGLAALTWVDNPPRPTKPNTPTASYLSHSTAT